MYTYVFVKVTVWYQGRIRPGFSKVCRNHSVVRGIAGQDGANIRSTCCAEVFHVGCRLLSNGRCACFEMFRTKLDHSIHLVQRILQTTWPSSLHHVCRFWCGATNKRPIFLCEDRVFVPSRLVTPVGKSSANRQMGGSKVFDSPFGGFHKWSYPNMVCKGKSEIEMDDN